MISVILTSYNKAKYIGEAIDSVINQSFMDWELLIIDDFSTDGAAKIIEEYAKYNPKIIVLRSDLEPDHSVITVNRYAHNTNLAFKQSRGEYITYLCDDDYFLPDRLERMKKYLDENPEVMICYGQQGRITMDGDSFIEMEPRVSPPIVESAYGIIDQSSVMHRRSLFNEVGGWNETPLDWLCGDAGFWRRIARKGYKFHLVPGGITDVHRFNELSLCHAAQTGRCVPVNGGMQWTLA
jgi:spore maturation protein CgeD